MSRSWLADLLQGQAQEFGRGDEGQPLHRVLAVHPVSGWSALGREQAGFLVEPQRGRRYAAAFGELRDAVARHSSDGRPSTRLEGQVEAAGDWGPDVLRAAAIVRPDTAWLWPRSGTYLSAVLLVGLVLSATLGWSWADPTAALVIAVIAVKEGRDAWQGKGCCAPTAHSVATVPSSGDDPDACGCRPGCTCCS